MPLPPLPTRLGSRLKPEELKKTSATKTSAEQAADKAEQAATAPLTSEHSSSAATAAPSATGSAVDVAQDHAQEATTAPSTRGTKAAKKAGQGTKAAKAAKTTAGSQSAKAVKAAKSTKATKTASDAQPPKSTKASKAAKSGKSPTATKSARAPKATQASPAPKTAKSSPSTSVPPPTATKPQAAAEQVFTAVDDEEPKLFVLDTNVLLHDANCLFMFKEHDVFIPMIVLEELDNQKKGLSEVARNARQVSRYLDAIVREQKMDQGLPLNQLGHREAQGKLHLQTQALNAQLPLQLPAGKADNAILHIVRSLQQQQDKQVILVSKDINMRLKAKALGLPAEDYRHDQVLDDSELLYSGSQALETDFWDQLKGEVETWSEAGFTYYRIRGGLVHDLSINEFIFTTGDQPFMAQVKEIHRDTAVIATLRDYAHSKNNLWGITARNREQNFALNLLMNPDCDFVSLLGQAGTGKTLLALASGLTQTLETQRYNEIIITRATVPVGDDIGFLPGTEEEKMAPWMGALEDNLEVLLAGSRHHYALSSHSTQHQSALEAIRAHIQIKSLSFMRGRTFLNKFVIIDEAQNLTPKQMKTLITRAGPGTKIVCLGNLAQIDTPYLTEGSSGLTYVVDRFKGWPHAGHITLHQGERSRLADFANAAL